MNPQFEILLKNAVRTYERVRPATPQLPEESDRGCELLIEFLEGGNHEHPRVGDLWRALLGVVESGQGASTGFPSFVYAPDEYELLEGGI